jgi:two-component system, chemotaxis family, protein-glutamate methylesterase/glutaminase
MKIRILVVDDSPFIRRMLVDWISKQQDMEVVGQATNGNEGIALCKSLKPDIVTLDVEMPECDGLTALKAIMENCPTPTLMISSLTKVGATETLRALELGAYDFVTKPGGANSLRIVSSQEEIIEKIRAGTKVKLRTQAPVRTFVQAPRTRGESSKVICLASSTGGPQALVSLWQTLPKELNVPILMVQHMPEGFTTSLARRLTGLGTVPCVEVKHGMKIEPGVAFLAPGGYHMRVDSEGVLRLDQEPSIHGVRPAADYLFSTASDKYGSGVVAAVLTGMGKDGAEGSLNIKKNGGIVFGENEESCTIYGMPRVAKEIGAIHSEHPIHEIAHVMIASLGGKLKNAA